MMQFAMYSFKNKLCLVIFDHTAEVIEYSFAKKTKHPNNLIISCVRETNIAKKQLPLKMNEQEKFRFNSKQIMAL